MTANGDTSNDMSVQKGWQSLGENLYVGLPGGNNINWYTDSIIVDKNYLPHSGRNVFERKCKSWFETINYWLRFLQKDRCLLSAIKKYDLSADQQVVFTFL